MPDRDPYTNALAEPTLADVVRNFWNPLRGPDPVRETGLARNGLLALPPLPERPRAELRNYTPPGPPRVQSEVAEAISPTMGGYGMGNLLATAGMDAANAKFDPETWGMLAAGMLTPGAAKGKIPPRVSSPIKAYHGSPHDFDKFSMDKIGTGEGAQAYGHGLYFAENEGVAKSYRDAQTASRVSGPEGTAARWLHMSKGDAKEAARDLRAEAEFQASFPNHSPAQVKDALDAVALLESGNFSAPKTGRMYEVALHATPDSFLDWDKPLSGQSPQVRATLDKLGVEQAPHLNESYLSVVHSLAPKMGVGEVPFEQVRSRISDALAKEGVPGIRYLDQGSRLSKVGGQPLAVPKGRFENPTHNFVVWNPEIIEILRKYGIVGPAALGLANALSEEPPQNY
jgi:hypothetical protein